MKTRKKKTHKLILAISAILAVMVIASFITTEIIQGVTEKITGGITNPGVPSGMDQMIQDMIEQRTKEITKQIMGGGQIPSGEIPGGIPTIPGAAPEVPCDLTPFSRQFSSTSYYTGPLLDSHLHMPTAFQLPSAIAQEVDWNPPVLDQDISKSELICLFDTEKINSVVGFYLVPNLLSGTFVSAAQQMEQQYPGRIIPFITPSHLTELDLNPEQIEEILASNPGLFKGLGEYGLYKADYKGKSPEDPYFLEIYDLADKHNLIVMIHPDENQQSAIERMVQKYSGVTFLFHGNMEMGPYAAEVVGKYPNAYFTIDADLWDIAQDHQSVNLYAAETKTEFIADFKRDYDQVQRAALARWKTAIEANPDQFLWGTDRGKDWHFDPEVGALLEESGRAFIGQLNPAVQEKFAYKNAQRLLN